MPAKQKSEPIVTSKREVVEFKPSKSDEPISDVVKSRNEAADVIPQVEKKTLNLDKINSKSDGTHENNKVSLHSVDDDNHDNDKTMVETEKKKNGSKRQRIENKSSEKPNKRRKRIKVIDSDSSGNN